MTQNEITANQLEHLVFEKRLDVLIGDFGRGLSRQIDYLVGTREYIVLDHHEHVWSGRDPSQALDAYYDITRR